MLKKADLRILKNLLIDEIERKYLGSTLGIIWAFINPLMLMFTYIFVFAFIFKSRIPGSESTFSYSIWIISGLGPWLAIVESILNGSNSVDQNKNIIKNVNIKLELIILSSIFTSIVALIITIFLVIFLHNIPTEKIRSNFPFASL